jgi:hypothetical protein
LIAYTGNRAAIARPRAMGASAHTSRSRPSGDPRHLGRAGAALALPTRRALQMRPVEAIGVGRRSGFEARILRGLFTAAPPAADTPRSAGEPVHRGSRSSARHYQSGRRKLGTKAARRELRPVVPLLWRGTCRVRCVSCRSFRLARSRVAPTSGYRITQRVVHAGNAHSPGGEKAWWREGQAFPPPVQCPLHRLAPVPFTPGA